MLGLGGKSGSAVGMVVNRAPAPPPQRYGIELQNPVTDRLREYAHRNRALVAEPEMVRHHESLHETLSLCGAGPSLRPSDLVRGSKVWAANSALPWLMRQGVSVDVGLGIDQTPDLLREWSDAPDVTYYLASTVDPELTAYLLSRGRRIRWFHNFVAWGTEADEMDHYNNGWPPGFMMGSGATVVPRSIGLAAWCGFERVDVHGADCAFGEGDIAHANGETAVEAFGRPVMMEGTIGDRVWRTRPDLLMAAVDLARMTQKNAAHIRLIGDTLAVALCGKPDADLNEVMRRLEPGEIPKDDRKWVA